MPAKLELGFVAHGPGFEPAQANAVEARSMPSSTTTSWPVIAFLAAVGAVGTFQISKAAVGLPAVRAEFGLTLTVAAWIAAIFPLLGTFTGALAGLTASSIGCRRSLTCGLTIIAMGSLATALGASFPAALLGRVLEGAGYLLTVVSAPAIMQDVAAPQMRGLAAALWTAGLQIGMTLGLAVGPVLIAAWSWHGLWLFGSALCAVAALLVPIAIPRVRNVGARANWLADLVVVARLRTPVVFALISFCYMFSFIGAVSLFPTMLVERYAVPLHSAGLMTATVVAASIVGALVAGWLRRAGWRLWSIALWSCTLAAPAAIATYQIGSSLFAWLACVAFSLFAGMLHPLAIEGAANAAPEQTLRPVALGLVMQANAAGQLGGPVVFGAAIEYGGWPTAAWPAAAALLATFALAGILGFSSGGAWLCRWVAAR